MGTQHVMVRVPDESDGIWEASYLDGLGRTFETQREGANGTVIIERVNYDERGLVSAASLPRFSVDAERWTTYTYDALGRLLTRTLPDGARESWVYNDWTTTYTNLRGFQWDYIADGFGRVERVIEPLAGGNARAETAYTYDALDRLQAVTDTRQRSTTIQYDTLDRRIGLVDPSLGASAFDYDANGNLTRQRDAKNQVVDLQYDALDQLTQKTYPDGRVIIYTSENTKPNARGRLTRVAEYSGAQALLSALEYEYDVLGRISAVTHVIDATSYRTEFTYTKFGTLATLKYPDGEVVTYEYDAAGQVRRVVGQDGVVREYLASATYNAAGQPTQLQLYGGVVNTRTYSPTRLWLDAVQSSAATPLQDLVFTRDPAGNIRNVQNNRDRTRDQAFEAYDALDRLTRAVGPYGTHTYSYDELGNLQSKAGVTYTYGVTADCGRALPYATASTSAGFAGTYDCNGNLLGDGTRTFVWDADDRPTSITHGAFGTTTFQYGPDGARIKKAAPSKTTRYAGLFEDRLEEGALVKHIYAGGRRIATRFDSASPDSDVYVPLDDQLGGLHVLVRAGQPVLTPGYLPFGEADPGRTTGSADWYQARFTGQEHDPETELYYYGARSYHPGLGRFISPDPIVADVFNPQALNRYSYVLNNPVARVDPIGLEPVVIPVTCPPDCGDTGSGSSGGGGLDDSGTGIGCEDLDACWRMFDEFVRRVDRDIDRGLHDIGHEIDRTVRSAGRGIDCAFRNCHRDRDRANREAEARRRAQYAALLQAWQTGQGPFLLADAQPGLEASSLRILQLAYTLRWWERGLQILQAAQHAARAQGTIGRAAPQVHHAISKIVHAALQQHPNLHNLYRYRDSRFVTRAVDVLSHWGRQQWHRDLDMEIAREIARNPTWTQQQFEAYLRSVYQRPELLARFPEGL